MFPWFLDLGVWSFSGFWLFGRHPSYAPLPFIRRDFSAERLPVGRRERFCHDVPCATALAQMVHAHRAGR